jgi:DNA ligase (NAD+)
MFKTHEEEIKLLKQLGFSTNPLNKEVFSLDQAWEFADEIQQNRHKLKYNIDGVVIKLNDNQLVEAAGVVGKTPRAWCAIKFPPEEIATKIKSLTWQVGRTGKLTPVIEFEPVLLMGTTVKRASMHNYKEVIDNNLEVGDLAIIRKAGDIIPEVVQVFKV